ncbi:hypothetical protein SAMN04487959_1342 [Modicisalibacter xianhensis]|uniref:Uncharacterized protein n=1 Tax=Modicisalibacter xianhensis TaxID=442341 RepID=A0A1I3GKI3_9GAMM|nr:hypothetical protein SAMN04487959_1342 [Halomonas xianhensis]
MASQKTREQLNDRADALNRNTGTSGQNIKYAKSNGNRGKQIQESRTSKRK